MATLGDLKSALLQAAEAAPPSSRQPLSVREYQAGLEFFHFRSNTYQDFIVPQLARLLDPLFDSLTQVSVLEVGPGPRSVLGLLPGHLRRKIGLYSALEPSDLFAESLEKSLCSSPNGQPVLPCLKSLPDIKIAPFVLDDNMDSTSGAQKSVVERKFDLVLFCHSMYGMRPKRKFVEKALNMLAESPKKGMVVIVHRDDNLQLDGLASHWTVSFPTGTVCVPDDNKTVDSFVTFIAGFSLPRSDSNSVVRDKWRGTCRGLARQQMGEPRSLLFNAPDILVAFTRDATALPELTALVPTADRPIKVKNREASLHHAAAVMRPKEIKHILQCVRWALEHGVGLTVVGGGHSGQCLWSNVVAVDMSAFNKLDVVTSCDAGETSSFGVGPLVVAEAGCKSGDVVRTCLDAGISVPLGTLPSVGAGLWLQGGLGHLSRIYGLTCDAIVGAVIVSVNTAQIFCVGQVPSRFQPANSVRPENEHDILWAMKGAGNNFGIVISVTFQSYLAPTYTIRNWIIPLNRTLEAANKLQEFERLIASQLPRNCSADAYIYCESEKLHLGLTVFECYAANLDGKIPGCRPFDMVPILGQETSRMTVDDGGLFETEIHMSTMHGGHSSGKITSFKRCLFLKDIGDDIARLLVTAIDTRPGSRCYIHLLQGGGAIADVDSSASAFGCRDWSFACIVTGVWPREQDGTALARMTVQWVYDTAQRLLDVGAGAYGTDLGPDPRDIALAARAFGPNLPRLTLLKRSLDPSNVLNYACPLRHPLPESKLVILVTGETCSGKDYSADVWASSFNRQRKDLVARSVSISDAIKKDYAAVTGIDLALLLSNRAYKEQHRQGLTAYFHSRLRREPQLRQNTFLQVVRNCAPESNVLFITGMRDDEPVATFWPLVPDIRLVEVRIRASEETRRFRRGCSDAADSAETIGESGLSNSCLVFNNDESGDEAAIKFSNRYLIPLVHKDLQKLAAMVRLENDFPSRGIQFRHILGIVQQPGGLALCISLLRDQYTGDWSKIDLVVSCEAGGFVFASPLATDLGLPLALIRNEGKLPPPTYSAVKSSSHISTPGSTFARETRIEIECGIIPRGATVLVVDDVLASGNTLRAMLQLLGEAGIQPGDIHVMVVAEFPAHQGRKLLNRSGFFESRIQSLLVFGGA